MPRMRRCDGSRAMRRSDVGPSMDRGTCGMEAAALRACDARDIACIREAFRCCESFHCNSPSVTVSRGILRISASYWTSTSSFSTPTKTPPCGSFAPR